MNKFSALLALCEWNPPVADDGGDGKFISYFKTYLSRSRKIGRCAPSLLRSSLPVHSIYIHSHCAKWLMSQWPTFAKLPTLVPCIHDQAFGCYGECNLMRPDRTKLAIKRRWHCMLLWVDVIRHNKGSSMGLLPDTSNCGLRMRLGCRERFPRHRLQRKPLVSDLGMHHGTWCMSLPMCILVVKLQTHC